MNKLIFLFAISNCIMLLANGCNDSNSASQYSSVVRYDLNKTIAFPDFDLTYIGERKETSKFPNGNSFTFTFYDFKIKKGDVEKTISWSSGTGDIAPANFEFNGQKYTLELRYFEKEKEKLDNDELVISKL
ncbi:MAG: hypothetical protein EHM58_03545 [Ignavibacteriae bacterium]|nr:MAG: hypothetical protein EHM58_03545 [Ignavibacteriota bacterium]